MRMHSVKILEIGKLSKISDKRNMFYGAYSFNQNTGK